MRKIIIVSLVAVLCISIFVNVVYGVLGNKTITVTYRNISIYINGKKTTPSSEPFIYNGSTYVPLRFVSETLDKEVKWDGTNNRIDINDKTQSSDNTQNPPENNNELPSSKSFTDEYGDMYIITIEKFEKNLQVANELFKPQEGETIVGVYFKTKNNGNHFKWVIGTEFTLRDYSGYIYSYNFLDIVSHKFFQGVNLAPGKSCEGWIFFVVPKTVLNNHFTLIYNTGERDEHFNEKTLEFNLN
jgi:hypothetical protein